jgi:hypothetical protein
MAGRESDLTQTLEISILRISALLGWQVKLDDDIVLAAVPSG